MTTIANQLTISFEPGLAERHKTLLGCIRETIYRNKKPLKAVAADMDLSESALSRKLSEHPDDRRLFGVDDLEAALVSTSDMTPIYYLVEKYLRDPEHRRAAAADALARMLPDLIALAREAGVTETKMKAVK